jgi:hypothetical protein
MSSSFYDQLQNVKDEDVAVAAPSQYIDGGIGLVPEATYDLLIKDFEPVFDDDGIFRKRITLKSLEIVGVPDEDLKKYLSRKVTNLAIFTTTYQRSGVTVSGLGDLIRGVDYTKEWKSLKDASDIIQEAIDKFVAVQMKIIWGAYDAKGFDAAGGKAMVDKSPEQKELRKKASVKGMRNFRPLPDATYAPEVAGPLSGEMLEARLEIDRVIASNKKRSMIST